MRYIRAAFRTENSEEVLFCMMEVQDKEKRKSGVTNRNVMNLS
jgi:hypothetical protein